MNGGLDILKNTLIKVIVITILMRRKGDLLVDLGQIINGIYCNWLAYVVEEYHL